jgi:glycosyltransferase involved in cell wall biosynthesis
LLIGRLTQARWVADFRDPWTDNPWKPAAVRTRFTDAVEARLEATVLRRAELVVSASEGIQAFFAQTGVPAAKLILVRNGIETIHERAPLTPGTPFGILHMGTFYHGRDPRAFLEALARVRRTRELSPRTLRVSLVGTSRDYQGQSIAAMAEALGVGDLVEFHDFMPRDQAIRMAAASDALLLLAQNQPDQVPQKLYEYLGTRVPIIAFADDAGETARLLRDVGGHHVIVDNNVDAAAAALSQLLVAPRGLPEGDLSQLRGLTSENQLRRLWRVVGV